MMMADIGVTGKPPSDSAEKFTGPWRFPLAMSKWWKRSLFFDEKKEDWFQSIESKFKKINKKKIIKK